MRPDGSVRNVCDGDPNTINDQWTANCQCVGTAVTFDCEGVANGPALPGTACNDGDPNTGNDAGCELQLRGPVTMPGYPVASPGTSCNDEMRTHRRPVDGDCQCGHGGDL
ncbi:MAG: hypothetical protein H6596_05535 [Flavobacteriales bacterium]|nr:hypothetical protein [Flavobacteriales bacterium]